MSETSPWQEEARRLIDSGMPVIEAARAVGQSEYTVRYVLDINGRRAKVDAWKAAKRVRNAKRTESKTSVRAYAEPAANRPLTLPRISMQALPDEDKREIRIAPRTRVAQSSGGADRIREIHRRMIREGRIREPGLPDQIH
ncbi:hypothetical protein [Bosea minatitlanensis]|uniref:GcrA cell cycle regulator n=1 Tax=Bosea minatitlanensis TaxID=128782 RepID=A0ABW0F4F4_9HYPH|nr:hypothetical protein [Bosea minatitlanensis]MCT4492753.1 hypothetical protein [Bosea minatitlanensis]